MKKKMCFFIIIFLLMFTLTAYGQTNTQSEIENLIDRIAMERGVPAVIIKSIAKIESNLTQFRADGYPVISPQNNIGVMQVGNYNNAFDTNKLMYDIEYNINAGIDVLLIKWNTSVISDRLARVGDMNPSVLENWYFALWAYNSWVSRNNPNVSSRAYQERIFDISETRYNQPITSINPYELPAYGVPSGYHFNTPAITNYVNLIQYSKGDLVEVKSILNDRYLYDQPGTNAVFKVNNGQIAEVIDEPIFINGYYWYKLMLEDGSVGWLQRNWIIKIGDSTHGKYPFSDILYHWCGKSVMDLYSQGFVNGKSENRFFPDHIVNKEEFISLYSRIFKLQASADTEIRFTDKGNISEWALDSIRAADEYGLLGMYGSEVASKQFITRGQITYMIANHLRKEAEKNGEIIDVSNVELPFEDIGDLAQWQIDLIKIAYSNGVISGQNSKIFNYNGTISRGAATSVLGKLQDIIDGE